jgi:hypothetical protein
VRGSRLVARARRTRGAARRSEQSGDDVAEVEALAAVAGDGAVGVDRLGRLQQRAQICCARRRHHRVARVTDGPSVGAEEADDTTRLRHPHNGVVAVVEAAVVEATKQEEIVEVGAATVGPMADVVAVGTRGGNAASGEAAVAVAHLQGAAQPSGDDAAAAADVDGDAIAFDDGDDLGVAAEPAGDGWRKARAVLDMAAATGVAADERRGVDVDDEAMG